MRVVGVPTIGSRVSRRRVRLPLLALAVAAATVCGCSGGGSGGGGSTAGNTGSSSGSTTSPSGPSTSATPCAVRPLTSGATVTGSFGSDTSKDCDGPDKGDQYSLTTSGQTDLEFVMTPNGFQGAISLYASSGRPVFADSGTGVRRGKAYLPSGEYRLVVGRVDSRAGSYTLSASPTSNSPCAVSDGGFGTLQYWNALVPGATIAGSLDSNDCGPSFNKNDGYFVTVANGETLAVTVKASANVSFVATRDEAGSPVVSQGTAPANVERTFTLSSLAAGRIVLTLLSNNAPVPLTYTLKVTTS